jgi:hypothetical protein
MASCLWWDGDHRSKFQEHVFALGRQDILYPKRRNPVIGSADMLMAPSHQLYQLKIKTGVIAGPQVWGRINNVVKGVSNLC